MIEMTSRSVSALWQIPFFSLLVSGIKEFSQQVESFDITDQLTNYINQNELTRNDKFDITANIENNVINFEEEDNISNDLLAFQIC